MQIIRSDSDSSFNVNYHYCFAFSGKSYSDGCNWCRCTRRGLMCTTKYCKGRTTIWQIWVDILQWLRLYTCVIQRRTGNTLANALIKICKSSTTRHRIQQLLQEKLSYMYFSCMRHCSTMLDWVPKLVPGALYKSQEIRNYEQFNVVHSDTKSDNERYSLEEFKNIIHIR